MTDQKQSKASGFTRSIGALPRCFVTAPMPEVLHVRPRCYQLQSTGLKEDFLATQLLVQESLNLPLAKAKQQQIVDSPSVQGHAYLPKVEKGTNLTASLLPEADSIFRSVLAAVQSKALQNLRYTNRSVAYKSSICIPSVTQIFDLRKRFAQELAPKVKLTFGETTSYLLYEDL